MFWNKKTFRDWSMFGMTGNVVEGSEFESFVQILEKAAALQDQNRRDYNLLFEKQNLILDHLKLKYVPETEKKEPAKLVKKDSYLDGNIDVLMFSPRAFTQKEAEKLYYGAEGIDYSPKPKRKYTKRKK